MILLVYLFIQNILWIKNNRGNYIIHFSASNLVILIFSLISYPLHSVWIVLIFIINHLIILGLFFHKYKWGIIILIFSVITFLGKKYYGFLLSKSAWQEAQIIPFSETSKKSKTYQEAYKFLNTNQYFLNDYCGYLLNINKPDSAINISNRNYKFMDSKGGSNTYRNIQLLCENCNRKKTNNIG